MKEVSHLELTGEGGRAGLVVLAAEVIGRWSQEASIFFRDLAKARAQAAPLILRGRVQAAFISGVPSWLAVWRELLQSLCWRNDTLTVPTHHVCIVRLGRQTV